MCAILGFVSCVRPVLDVLLIRVLSNKGIISCHLSCTSLIRPSSSNCFEAECHGAFTCAPACRALTGDLKWEVSGSRLHQSGRAGGLASGCPPVGLRIPAHGASKSWTRRSAGWLWRMDLVCFWKLLEGFGELTRTSEEHGSLDAEGNVQHSWTQRGRRFALLIFWVGVQGIKALASPSTDQWSLFTASCIILATMRIWQDFAGFCSRGLLFAADLT